MRVDSHLFGGYTVPRYYDSLMAKLIVKGDTREAALATMQEALAAFEVSGIETNIPFLQFLVSHPDFADGSIDIKWIENTLLPQFLER